MDVWVKDLDGGPRSRLTFFFMNGAREMVAATVETSPIFRVGARTPLFTLGSTMVTSDIAIPYDVGFGERQFLMARAYRGDDRTDNAPPDVMLVVNWFEELKARVPN